MWKHGRRVNKLSGGEMTSRFFESETPGWGELINRETEKDAGGIMSNNQGLGKTSVLYKEEEQCH